MPIVSAANATAAVTLVSGRHNNFSTTDGMKSRSPSSAHSADLRKGFGDTYNTSKGLDLAMSNKTVSENISFEQAIELTRSLLDELRAGGSPDRVAATVAELVRTVNGARGFFVAYLTADDAIADIHPPEIVEALQSSPDTIADLLAKNLAMSAAMVLTHRRNGNEEMALSSARVRDRATALIQKLNLKAVRDRCGQLYDSAATGTGAYQEFLERWGYDAEQKELMQQALAVVL